jgi:16S rRNA (guanine(966)-N(2))-methyltransferase RsmD
MGKIRVISGIARGRRLKSVPGDITRPVTDRVKEALFNIIGADIQGAELLDLFAGTGSVGIEALSRGADFVRFNDRSSLAAKTIRENLEITGLSASAEVIQRDAFKLLKEEADRAFDYVYIAPPQYKRMWVQALSMLDENPAWLDEHAWVVIQIDPVEHERVVLRSLVEFDQRKYGSTLLIFYSYHVNPSPVSAEG